MQPSTATAFRPGQSVQSPKGTIGTLVTRVRDGWLVQWRLTATKAVIGFALESSLTPVKESK